MIKLKSNSCHDELQMMIHYINQIAELGRSRNVPIRSDWEVVKESIMIAGVLKEFQTHEKLAALLLSTGNQ